jgi:hypothetical protein
MANTSKVREAVASAKPVVERLAKDEDFRKHAVAAAIAAKTIYDRLAEDRTAKTIASKLVQDKSVQKELRHAVEELQEAAKRAKRRRSHKLRNTLIFGGIVLGLLYNPVTGPGTRRWLREKILGPEETFEYDVDGGLAPST